MNTWQKRSLALLLLMAAMYVHAVCLEDVPNTPMGMLTFHGSAGLIDLLLLRAMPLLLNGKLCGDMQMLCMFYIALNFGGWLLYMAYAPPIIYNATAYVLTYIQWGRLFVTDENNADYLGRNLVCRSTNGRT